MTNETRKLWPPIRLVVLSAVVIVSLPLLLFLAPWECSTSSVQDLTWRIDFAKSEQSLIESNLILIDGMFEWEEMADDFSMHDEWVGHKVRSNNRLDELSVVISDFQNQLDECN